MEDTKKGPNKTSKDENDNVWDFLKKHTVWNSWQIPLRRKKINELEEITTETLKMKHREKNKLKKENTASVNSGTTSNALIYMQLEP